MVPLIQDEIVDKRKWIDKEDFIDLLALTQSVPGIFAVNIAIFIGYKLRKFRGALAMALGTILPSFFILADFAMEKVGAAIRATTAGRIPLNIFSTIGYCLNC